MVRQDAPSDEEFLREVCFRWAKIRGPHPRWCIDSNHPERAQLRSRATSRCIRLSYWEACVWLLVVEASRKREDTPDSMFLAIVPGWRVQPARSSRSYTRAREHALARAQPKGEWEWIEDQPTRQRLQDTDLYRTRHDGVPTLRNCYPGRLRWYDDDPAPHERERLLKVAQEWSEHGEVARDWRLAGRPSRCPVPSLLAEMPELGTWLMAYIERRTPAPAWYPAIAASHAELLAS